MFLTLQGYYKLAIKNMSNNRDFMLLIIHDLVYFGKCMVITKTQHTIDLFKQNTG